MKSNWIIRIVDQGYKTTRAVYIYRDLPNGTTEFLDGTIVSTADAVSLTRSSYKHLLIH